MNKACQYIKLLLILAFGFISIHNADAHAPDQGYLWIRIYSDAIGGRFELNAEDINRAIGSNIPDEMTDEIVQPHIAAMQAYIKSHAAFKSDLGNYEINFTETDLLILGDEIDYVKFNFSLGGVTDIPDELDIEYNLLFDRYEEHRGLLIMEYNWKAGILKYEGIISNIFSPSDATEALSLTGTSIWKGFWALIKLGVWHIWIGLDHILFLVALILPSVVRRREEVNTLGETSATGEWKAVEKFKPAFFYIIKIVTFFTIAHSITLALAALGIVELSSRWVETIIALSIALAAFHNIRPIFKQKEWLIAFLFGLFHGFGFASVLGEKGLEGDYMTLSLLGFNIGVELGQLLIICMIFPVLFLLRKTKIYPPLIKYGSLLLILISLYWVVERGFDTDLTLGTYFWKFWNGIFG